MISHAAIQVVLSKAAAEDKEIVQLDIVAAFLERQDQGRDLPKASKGICDMQR